MDIRWTYGVVSLQWRIGCIGRRTYGGHMVLWRTYGVVADIWCCVSPSGIMAAKVPPSVACTHAH